MKKHLILLSVLIVLFFSCENVSDGGEDSLGTTIITLNYDVNEPDWFDDNTLFATTGYSDKFIKFNISGAVLQEYVVNEANILRMNLISVSPDKGRVAFSCDFTDGNGNSVVIVYHLTDDSYKIISGTGNLHGPDFYTNDVLIYFEYDYTVADKVSMRVHKYDLSDDSSSVVFEATEDLDGNGDSLGDTYWWPKINRSNGNIALCTWDRSLDSNSYTVIDMDGKILCSLSSDLTFDTVRAIAWYDDDNIVASVKESGDSKVYLINLTGKTKSLLLGPVLADAINYYGMNINDSGTKVAGHYYTGQGNRVFLLELPE